MKKFIVLNFIAILLLSACGSAAYNCQDPLGCVEVKSGENIKMGALLTLSGPDSPYGIDALRGTEIAISDYGKIKGFAVELIQRDELCSEQGGIDGATAFANDAQMTGIIGGTCSSASIPAAQILTEAKMILISPSSTTPSLTEVGSHEAGFLRVIYNDKAQGKFVAEFAIEALGVLKMVTIHDGTAYSEQLQKAACENFEQLGGSCLAQIQIESGKDDPEKILRRVAALEPDILYYPIYTTDGVALTNQIRKAGLTNLALISSDGLLSTDFIQQTNPASQGMYLSGPTNTDESADFVQKYTNAYGEAPIAAYHLQGYDAATLLLQAIAQVSVESNGTLFIPRQSLRAAVYQTKELQGLSAVITCSPSGDCITPDIKIFQVQGGTFTPIYP